MARLPRNVPSPYHPTRIYMNPANIIPGLIQLAIAIFFLLVAIGVAPIGKDKKRSEEKRIKYAWFWWLGFVVLTIMAIAKMAGTMG